MRRLTLHRESLGDLTADELSGIAGGASHLCPTRQATVCYVCVLSHEDCTTLTERTCTW